MEWINDPLSIEPYNQCKKKDCPSYGCYSKCDNVCPDFCLIKICPKD